MALPSIEADQACQAFNRLIDYVSSEPKGSSVSANAALHSISKLPLIREVMEDLGLSREDSITTEGNHAFVVRFRCTYNIIDRLQIKLEDASVTSTFLKDLKEVAFELFAADLATQSTTTTFSTMSRLSSSGQLASRVPRRSSSASYIPSHLSQVSSLSETSKTTASRSTPDSLAPPASSKGGENYNSDHAVPKTSFGLIARHKYTPNPASHNTLGMKRLREASTAEELGHYAPLRKMRYRGSSYSSHHSPLLEWALTPQQGVYNQALRLTASGKETFHDNAEVQDALLFVKIAIEDGFRIFKEFFEAYKQVPALVERKNVIWPAYLEDYDLPALRRYQEASAECRLAKGRNTAGFLPQTHMVHYLRLLAGDDFLDAYRARKGCSMGQMYPRGSVDEMWRGCRDFGKTVQRGAQFRQRQLNEYPPETEGVKKLKASWGKFLICEEAYGPGLKALRSRKADKLLSQVEPDALQRAIDTISKDTIRASCIKNACDEAHRLMLALWDDKDTVNNKSLVDLEILLAKVSQ